MLSIIFCFVYIIRRCIFIHNIDKTISVYVKYRHFSITNINTFFVYITCIQIFYTSYGQKVLSILYIYYLSTCGIDKNNCLYQVQTKLFLSILHINKLSTYNIENCLYLIWKEGFFSYDIQTICLHVVYTKQFCLYQVQTKFFLSILHMENLSI